MAGPASLEHGTCVGHGDDSSDPFFRLHRKARLRRRENESGNGGVLRIFDSVVELDGGFKILSYPS